MSEVRVSPDSHIGESIQREKKIVNRRLEKYRKKLEEFEQEHGMETEEFIEKFEAGEIGDNKEWFEWKFAYEAVKRLEEKKEELGKAFN